MGFIRVLWVIFFLSFFLKTHAQTYPVQTNIVAVGPYYNYLNYYADENAHLQIITTLTDFNTAPVNVRLRIQFIGPGYTISTKPNAIIGQVFTIEPGVPLFINGIDLLPYFYEANLIKSPSGINLNNLPEGLTTVCVDVIRDGVSQEVLSTNNCTSFFLQRFQPPQGVFPQCGSNINPDEGFYTFQWSPPIGYVPSIGSELNYTFSLYEWNDPNNYNIFQTGQGLVYQTYIQQPIVQLSNFDLTLQNGKNYVWRVQAQLLSNGLPVNMIENNGLSGICTFTYGTAQTLEESLADGLHIDISAMGEGERKGKASWTVIDNTPGEGLSTFSSYIVYYRKKPSGNEGYELTWFQDTVSTFNHFIYQLEPATTYEVKVAGRVGENYVSEISETKEFTTYSPRAYACGETDMPYRSQTYQPLAQAQAGMHFQIGQFSMQVTEISPVGAAGHYQGKGLIPIAFLAGAKAKVTFDDILVDDKYMVREGIMEVMTKGLEQWLHEQYMQFIDPIYVSGTVDSAYVENGMAWVVIDGQPQSWEFDPPDYPIIVNDDSGTQYIIHPDGTITKSTYFEILEEWNDVTAQDVVTFSQNENETFGFDAKEHTQWHDNYDIIQLADSSYYFASNKSMGVGKTDVVHVNLPTGGTGTYTYKINNGAAQPLSAGPLTLPAQNTKGDFNLEVFQGTKKVGKLKLVVFEEKEINVVVVPLVSAAPAKAQLETALNETLGEANLKFNVAIKPQWNNAVFTSSKTIQLPEEVGLMNKYSSDMASLRDAYFAENDTANKNAFYLFVVPGFSDNATDGYMVRGKSLGFVAANANLQTYCHELGHGVGALKHSWQDNGPAQGMTSNLMDYSEDAVNLTKAQWKQIRSWSVLPSMWDEAEDGELRLPKSLDTFDLVGGFCMLDMNCIMKPYFRLSKNNSNDLRFNDSIVFNYYSDSALIHKYATYVWKYNGGKIWSYIKNGQNSTQFSISINDTIQCDDRITSYCLDTIIIPPKPPKVYDYLIYVAYPMAMASPGVNDNSIGVQMFRNFMNGNASLQVGHTGICLIKSDTVTKRAKIDYYDFGRFDSQQSALGNGVRRHFDLGYIGISIDPRDTTYKITNIDSVETLINQIPYFASNMTTYARKEIGIAPILINNYSNAENKANANFYSVCSFGFGNNKSFCTDFVHDIFTVGGIPMVDISARLDELSYKLALRKWLLDHNKDRMLMKYWDQGDSFLKDVEKSPLPINFAIYIKTLYPLFN